MSQQLKQSDFRSESSSTITYQSFVMCTGVMNYLKDHYGLTSGGYTDAQIKQAEEAVLLDGLRVLKYGGHW